MEEVQLGGAGEKDPVQVITRWARTRPEPLLLALDAPLGWPVALAKELPDHSAGKELTSSAHSLFRRATDDFICERLEKRPLDVGADRIARTARAALALVGDLRRVLEREIPLVWHPKLTGTGAIEIYPAATLKAHGIRRKGVTPVEVLEEVGRKVQLPASREAWQEHRDAVDAVVCLLAGHDFLRGDAMSPPDEQAHQRARKEGWIWARSG